MNKVVLQGSVFGPIKCAVQIDTFGRDCLSDGEGMGIYQYKKVIDTPALSMIDDILGISEPGIKSIELNSIISAKIE